MIKPPHCFYNLDTTSVKVTFFGDAVLAIDCKKVENDPKGNPFTA